jgi:hypothetical protein
MPGIRPLSIKNGREVCMQNYDIRSDDKYGQLAQIDVAAEAARHECDQQHQRACEQRGSTERRTFRVAT